MRKILELKNDEAEIFKNFNKFNSKKMKIVNDNNKYAYNQLKNEKGSKKKK